MKYITKGASHHYGRHIAVWHHCGYCPLERNSKLRTCEEDKYWASHVEVADSGEGTGSGLAVQLVEPKLDSDGGNDSVSVSASRVLLFVTVGSLTEELLSGMGLALDESSNGVQPTERGLCQRLFFTQNWGVACSLGSSQSLESQSELYNAIRNRLTTYSKPKAVFVRIVNEMKKNPGIWVDMTAVLSEIEEYSIELPKAKGKWHNAC